jgi:hypothetical protein
MECGTACSTTDTALHCNPDGVTCDSSYGGNVKCTGCTAGFHTDASTGGQCMTPCSGQRYGADCVQTCVAPSHCVADGGWECHSKTGEAKSCDTCDAGFAGTRHMWPPDQNLFLIF